MKWVLEEQVVSRLGHRHWLVVGRFDTERDARRAMQRLSKGRMGDWMITTEPDVPCA